MRFTFRAVEAAPGPHAAIVAGNPDPTSDMSTHPNTPAWEATPGEAEVITVPSGTRSEGFALTPEWVARGLGIHQIAVWEHPCGVWGAGDRHASVVYPDGRSPRFLHLRRADGTGLREARLAEVVCRGDVRGLDDLAEALRNRGHLVREEWEEDRILG